MSEMGLTALQATALDFISERAKVRRTPPSYDEIKDHLGLKSKSSIARIVRGLAERGHLRTLPGRARSIEIIALDKPAGSFVCSHCGKIAGSSACRRAALETKALLNNAAALHAGSSS